MRRSSLIIAFVLAAALAAVTPAHAAGPGTSIGPDGAPGTMLAPGSLRAPSPSGAGTFTFYGSGFGHGIGMSQWGSYGLASRGWSSTRILTHFYSKSKVSRPANPVKKIRIGLTYDRTKIHLGARHGPVRLWIGKPGGTLVAKIPNGQDWTVRSPASGYAIRDANGKLIGGKTWGGPGFNLYATYADTGSRVFVPEADAIWGKGFSYSRGHLEFNLYRCAGGCLQRLIIPLGFEEYLFGLGEMPSSWPMAALETQAVAARTYATYQVKHYGLRASCNCHLSDGADDQVYVGWSKESGIDGDRWMAAVRHTRGRVVTYAGAPIQAFFAASDGGHSEDVQNVWHNGDPAYAIPYLRGVCDQGEQVAANPWTDWSYAFSASTLSSRLAPYTGGIGTVTGFAKVVRGSSGRVIRATVKGSNGTAVVSGWELRGGLGLPDDRIWINENRNITGKIRAKYDGVACKPGLPTTPVATMPGGARQKFQSGGIFRNNGADVTVWLKGPIYTEYMAVRGTAGKLGLPTSSVGNVPGSSGRRALFETGRIYWSGRTGARALWGPVLSEYLSRGAAAGALGFPTTRVHKVAGKATAGFQHGTISCATGGGCTVS
jgi:stage II sporulation protein D